MVPPATHFKCVIRIKCAVCFEKCEIRIFLCRPNHLKNFDCQIIFHTAAIINASILVKMREEVLVFRLSKTRCHYDLIKFSFTNRIVNIWNSLSNAVLDVDSVDLFKSRLDNFWMFKDVK